MRGATGTITVREQADKSAATMMPAPTYAFMTASFFECRSRDTTRGRRPGQSEFPLKPLAHPGGGAHRAAEAVDMHADRVARLVGARVARHGHQLIARIG